MSVKYPEGEPGVMDLGSRHFVAPMVTATSPPPGMGESVESAARAIPTAFRWWHDCPKVAHQSWEWFGDDGHERSGHTIVCLDPLTVAGSLVCKECGDHGFIRQGRWDRA